MNLLKEKIKKITRNRIAFSLSLNTILPLLVLGIVLTMSGIVSIKYTTRAELEKRLMGVCKQAREQFYLAYPGEVEKIDGIFYSEEESISNFVTTLEQYRTHFEVDVSVVIGEEVAVTTIRDKYGKANVGHIIPDKDALKVTRAGKNYISRDGEINGTRYYCVSVPLYYRGYVIGMVFAGIPYKTSTLAVSRFVRFIVSIFIILISLATLQVVLYSKSIGNNLGEIRNYLDVLTKKQTPGDDMSPKLLNRTDEIGDLGRYVTETGNQLRTIIGRDTLTGLYNRRTGRQFLDLLWDNARINFTSLAIVMCDIDFFKKVNDTYGHDEGDVVLKRIGAIMDKCCGEQKFAFAIRWGGEEFLMGFLASGPQTMKIVNKIRDEVKEQVFVTKNNESFSISMTFGVVTASSTEEISSVVSRADSKLYEGKKAGRDRIIY